MNLEKAIKICKEIVLIPKDDTDTTYGTILIDNELYMNLPRGVVIPIKYINLEEFYIMDTI